MAASNADLQTQIYAAISQNQLPLSRSLLAEIGDMLACLQLTTLTLEQATPHTDVEYAKVSGTVQLPSLQLSTPLAATLTAAMDGASVVVALTIDALPAGWQLSSSFGNLPITISYANNLPTFVASQLEQVQLTNPMLVARNRPDLPNYLWAGLNVVGTVAINSVFSNLVGALGLTMPALALTGLVTLPADPGQPTAFDLRARATTSYTIGGYPLDAMFARIWTYIPPDLASDIADTRIGLGGAITLGSLPPMIITADITDATSFWALAVQPDAMAAQTFDGFADLAGLAGNDTSQFQLPDTVDSTGLQLQTLALGFQTPATLLYTYVAVSINKTWNPIPQLGEKLAITLISASWLLTHAGNALDNQGTVHGSVGWTLANRVYTLDVEATVALAIAGADFMIAGHLRANQGGLLSSNDILSSFGMADSILPQLTLDKLAFAADARQQTCTLYATLDGSWSLPLGALTRFAINGELAIQLAYNASWSGTFSGTAQLAGFTLHGNYTIGSSKVLITGRAESLDLWAVVQQVCDDLSGFQGHVANNSAIQHWLNITNPYLSIEKDNQNYSLQLGGSLLGDNNGPQVNVNFSMVDTPAGFGAFIAVQLSKSATSLSALTGLELSAFDEYIQTASLALAFSSIDSPGYAIAIPTMPQSMQAIIPSTIQIVKGITIVASLDASQVQLSQFFSKFNITNVAMFAAIQISAAADFKLIAGLSVSNQPLINGTYRGLTLAAYLEIESTEQVAMFVGQLQTTVQQQRLQFDIALALTANGFTIEGSMIGTWPNIFGIKGLALSDAALAVGIDWEGIPTIGFAGTLTVAQVGNRTMQGALAVVADSEDPAQSVLAGAVSDFSLMDGVVLLAGVAEDSMHSTSVLSALADVLDSIRIGGFTDFQTPTVPASLAAALNRASQGGTSTAADYTQAISAIASAFNNTLSQNLLVVAATATTWFITDRGNDLTHYQLTLNGATITVEKEAQFYWVEAAVDMGPGLQFKPGNQVSGKLDFLGLSGVIAATISSGQGISVYVNIDPLTMFHTDFLSITSSQDTSAGPMLAVLSYHNPSFPDGNADPHISAQGAARVLGHDFASIDLQLSSSAIQFSVVDSSLLGGFQLSGSFAKEQVRGSATATVGLAQPIDLGTLGQIHLPSVQASIGMCWNDCANLFAGQGSFMPQGNGAHVLLYLAFDLFGHHTVGPVDVDFALLAHMADTVVQNIIQFFQALFKDATTWLTWLYNAIITGVAAIGQVLNTEFGMLWHAAVQLMHDVGYAADVIVDSIVAGYQVARADVTEFADEVFETAGNCAMKLAKDTAVAT